MTSVLIPLGITVVIDILVSRPLRRRVGLRLPIRSSWSSKSISTVCSAGVGETRVGIRESTERDLVVRCRTRVGLFSPSSTSASGSSGDDTFISSSSKMPGTVGARAMRLGNGVALVSRTGRFARGSGGSCSSELDSRPWGPLNDLRIWPRCLMRLCVCQGGVGRQRQRKMNAGLMEVNILGGS